MVPKHARKRKEALHEPQRRAGVLPAAVGNADGTEPLALARSLGRRDACPTLGALRFKVPMHVPKRKEALQQPSPLYRSELWRLGLVAARNLSPETCLRLSQ